ncbi:hypothetical protein C8J56DRAFT_1165281 [Mycena floridula]|nr:hypothetical protein C8J56DRAFT_1165281 [Mycena floridula]
MPPTRTTATRSRRPSPYPNIQAGFRRPCHSDVQLLDDSDDDSDDGLIPRLVGSAGKPRQGGYVLRDSVAEWSDRRYNRTKRHVHELVDSKLDTSLPFTKQPVERIEEIKLLTQAKFSRVGRYRDCWIVSELIRARLQTSVPAHKRRILAAKYRQYQERMKQEARDQRDKTVEDVKFSTTLSYYSILESGLGD